MSLKYVKCRNTYEKQNLWVSLETMEGYSYSWYCILRKIDGKVVVNSYAYSRTTSRHYSEICSFLRGNGISFASIEAPNGLKKLSSAISLYRDRIQGLEDQISAPRSRASSNKNRAAEIQRINKYLDFTLELKNAEEFQAQIESLLEA